MNLFAFRKQLDALILPLVSGIAKLPLSANQWTLIGVLVGCLCSYFLSKGFLGLGFAALVIRGLCDHLDGYVARNKNDRSTFGAILDDTADRWILGVITVVGVCIYRSTTRMHWH